MNYIVSESRSKFEFPGFRALHCLLYMQILLYGLAVPPTAFAEDTRLAEAITQTIDKHFATIWEARGVTPAQPAGRSSLIRRLSLDLIGRIPTGNQAKEFVRSECSECRAKAIQQLVERSPHHLAVTLQEIWFPQTTHERYHYLVEPTRKWIAEQLRENRPLNDIVAELITVPYSNPQGTRRAPPRTLIEANDHRAERMAANVTGNFLGVDLSCAQCHDHPFSRFTQDEFWQTAAFFQRTSPMDSPHDSTIRIPGTNRRVTASLFSGQAIDLRREETHTTGRETFAIWMVSPENPYLAKHTVNEIWKALLGRYLVEPSGAVQAEAQLLDELASLFVASSFDLQGLLLGIVSSRPYQLSSECRCQLPARARFSCAAVRSLGPEQLFDSLCIAAGRSVLREDLDNRFQLHRREVFCRQFQTCQDKPNRSIAQALGLWLTKPVAG